MPKVIPFQISISPFDGSGNYALRVQSNSIEVRAAMTVPDEVFAIAASELSPARAEELGLMLGRALFVQPVRDLLLHTARTLIDQGSYIQIQLRIAAPDLVSLPWEWLTLGTTRAWRPATRDDYMLVRVGRQASPIDPLAVAGPLRVLIVAARGEEQQADALARALDEQDDTGLIAVEILRNATPTLLEQTLQRQKVHILHCIAPVDLSQSGTPRLLLGKSIEGFDLARMLADAPRLRLATFTGTQSNGAALGPAALAALALDEQLPATVAFTNSVSPMLAARFAATCYAQLADGAAIDQAVTAGRQALEEAGRGWGVPQLWVVPGGERLFNVAGVRPHAARESMAGIVERLRSVELPQRSQPAPRRPLRSDAPRSIRRLPLESQNARAAAPRRSEPARSLVRSGAAPRSHRTRRASRWTTRMFIVAVALCLLVVASRALRPSNAQSSALEAIIPVRLLSTPTPVTPTPTPSIPIPDRSPDSYATYETVAGDTFESLADKLNSNALAIAALNRLDPTEKMREGRPLVIPVYKAGVAQTAGLLVTRGNPNTPKVALTFDVEIDEQSLYDILDILRQNNIKATFFFPGRWAEAYPKAVKAAIDEGHEVGNHSLTHPFFSRIGLDGALNELEQGESIVKGAGGVTTRPYFRFPYGDSTPQTIALAGQQGYMCIHWSADDPAVLSWLDRMAANPSAGNGGILLMHGRPATVAMLPDVIARLKAMGLQPTSLSDVLR